MRAGLSVAVEPKVASPGKQAQGPREIAQAEWLGGGSPAEAVCKEDLVLRESLRAGAQCRVIGLFPELLTLGGVQRVGQHVGACLAAFACRRGGAYRFLSLNDPVGLHRVRVGETEFVVSGYERSKLSFSLAALRAAGRHPSLVVAAHPHLAPVAWGLKTRSPHLRVLVFSHGIEVRTLLSRLRRWTLRQADMVLAPSRWTAECLLGEQGLHRENVRHVPWGLDPEFAVRLAERSTPGGANHLPARFPEGRVVLTVGRWSARERYKGLDTLIACLAGLLARVPDVYLVAIGEGNDLARLERLARETGVAARVVFLSGVTQPELLAAYRHCDVFALPSGGEGFGLVFLEAMAQGKPVVGAAHGGALDLIEDGVTGLLVPYGDVTRLSLALEALLTNDSLCRQMGSRARERVRQAYLYEHFAARLENVLRTLCAS